MTLSHSPSTPPPSSAGPSLRASYPHAHHRLPHKQVGGGRRRFRRAKRGHSRALSAPPRAERNWRGRAGGRARAQRRGRTRLCSRPCSPCCRGSAQSRRRRCAPLLARPPMRPLSAHDPTTTPATGPGASEELGRVCGIKARRGRGRLTAHDRRGADLQPLHMNRLPI